MTQLTAIILAGGRSQRMGRDKATIAWGDDDAVHRVARLARNVGATDILVSGGDYGLPFVSDPVAHGGPVGGLLAAAAARPSAGRFLVLAVDAPTLAAEDVAVLLAVAGPGATFADFPLPMVVTRGAIPWGCPAETSLRRFVEAAGLRTLTPPAARVAHLRGANTPQDLQALRAAASQDVP